MSGREEAAELPPPPQTHSQATIAVACMEATYANVDLLLARLLTGDRPTKEDVAEFGDGGLCLRCPTCVFPACPFGK